MGDAIATLPMLSDLSLRQRIGQLVFVRIGSNLPPVKRVEEDEQRVAALLETCHVGGLILFNGGQETRASLDRLQRLSPIPLLVGSDIERGVGQQVKGYTLFPHAMALERHDHSIDAFVRATAEEAREVGIHITFAPVADVATNPLNPIITIRAFSENAQRAADATSRFVAMAEQTGLLTTAKHFPGHGDTLKDSHDSLPSLPKTLEELRQCELRPFEAAIDAGCSLIMTAHVAFPSIDPSGEPATASEMLLQQVLRSELGFRGAICSDSLLMAGIRDRFVDEGQMSLATLRAGVDLLLDLNDPAGVVDYLVQCVDSGQLSETRVAEACSHVLALKQRAFLRQVQRAASSARPPEHAAKFDSDARAVARDAIAVLTNSGRLSLPLRVDKPLTVILLKPFETSLDPPEQPLADALREPFVEVHYAQLGPNADPAAYREASEMARNAEQLLIAIIVRPAAWHASGLRPAQREFVTGVTEARPDVALVSLGVPYALNEFPEAAVTICTFSDVPVSQHAFASFLAEGS